MSAVPMHITIDVEVDGREIHGQASDGEHPVRPFTGWLGLISALETLLATPTDPPQGRSIRP
jgi:hypothetical protein